MYINWKKYGMYFCISVTTFIILNLVMIMYVCVYLPWRRGIHGGIVSACTEETEALGRKIESRQGVAW
jgi:hypothetical protein